MSSARAAVHLVAISVTLCAWGRSRTPSVGRHTHVLRRSAGRAGRSYRAWLECAARQLARPGIVVFVVITTRSRYTTRSSAASCATSYQPSSISPSAPSRRSSQDTLGACSTPSATQCFYHHVPHVRQLFNWDCGLSCVLMILRAVGIWHQDLAMLRALCPTTRYRQ